MGLKLGTKVALSTRIPAATTKATAIGDRRAATAPAANRTKPITTAVQDKTNPVWLRPRWSAPGTTGAANASNPVRAAVANRAHWVRFVRDRATPSISASIGTSGRI